MSQNPHPLNQLEGRNRMTDPRVAAIEKRLSEATQPVIRDNWKPVAPPATKEVSDMQKRDESAFREQCQRKGVDICTKEVIEPEIAAPVDDILFLKFRSTLYPCLTCGAIVGSGHLELHNEWHKQHDEVA